jgi:hypothetical protein
MMETTFKKLQSLNVDLPIKDIFDPAFARYGRVIHGLDGKKAFEFAKNQALPAGVAYEPSVAGLEADAQLVSDVSQQVYGGMPVQIGWCYGRNNRLGGMEYHKGDEVVAAVTDVVLLLGSLGDVTWNPQPEYDTSKVEAFYVPEGAFVEIYGSTLHYAPIHSSEKNGFMSMIILPKGTNTMVDFAQPKEGEAMLLFGRNKWLLVHPEEQGAVQAGAYAGLKGKNIEVRTI